MVPQFVFSSLFVVMLVLSFQAAEKLPERREVSVRRLPRVAIGLFTLVAVPSLLQFAYPGIYRALNRNSDLIQHHGQWWRPFTSFMVQDGGVPGTAFNLFVLAIVAVAAERVWGSATTLALFFGILAVFSIDTFLIAQPDGGGNSGVTFRLATTMAGLALVTLPGRRSVLLALGIAADGVVCLALGNAHGEPMITGIVVGVLVALVQRRRRAPQERCSTEGVSSAGVR
jgi:membrane associated rhomboid family serine protease